MTKRNKNKSKNYKVKQATANKQPQNTQSKNNQISISHKNSQITQMKLDSRYFSKKAHQGLNELRDILKENLGDNYYSKASNLVRGLTAYISTWGLHRLSGDAKKFLSGTASDTKYKGYVYQKFLENLKSFSGSDFDVEDESTLINLPLKSYTGLNRLAIELAKEWSFWSVAVLGEPSND